jgi:class 3 adenylate cyclase/tetratricopeptide (TPR) repeat protein
MQKENPVGGGSGGSGPAGGPSRSDPLEPYVPRLVVDWLRESPDDVVREVTGSLAFVDISGFTTLTERLARTGKVGAEELSDLLDRTFAKLLEVAYLDGAGLVKWGGDAVLLLFTGEDHAARACRAAYRMRACMRRIGRLETTAGRVTLRMSVGVHSGVFHFFLVGDPAIHRELLISGPAASLTAELEGVAAAGEVVISAETAAGLSDRSVGAAKGGGFLLASEPRLPDLPIVPRPPLGDLDIASTIPEAIREHLLAAAGEAEHRQIAVAFVQFSGTDTLLAEQGPEALAAALDEMIRNVQEATSSHDVTFFETDINRDGGKVMLTAGAPRSADHDEERMLRAARRIMDHVGVLPLRIGINRGGVFSGDFGPPFRRTYSVKGDAVNLAARVMGKALPGQVLATSAVVDRSRSLFDVEPLPPFLVKGKSDLVHALSIGALVGDRAEGEDASPMLGRAAEMSVLTAAMDAARARRGSLVELVGEPGIGKSRLIQELRSRAADVAVVTAVCDEFESATAYHPFRGLLRELLGIPQGADDALAVQRLHDRVAFNSPDLLPWLPLLGVVIDVPVPPTPATARLDERFRKTRLEEVTTQFLSVVLPTASMLVFEDVHLMDVASAELLERVVVDIAHQPWLLLVTRRDLDTGFRPSPGTGATSVRPGPLPTSEALEIVSAALSDSPLPPHQLAELVERAGGNPLFLRGLVLAARTGTDLAALPESVEALINSQIDRLPPDERTVLRYASVLGVDFREADLRAILAGHALPTGRAALQRMANFLQPTGHGRFRFEHALIRDVAYEGMPYRRRQELHGRVGELIEGSAVDTDDVSELLSLHYFHAARLDKAWHYSRVAGERARSKYASAEAVQLLSRAVAVARQLPSLGSAERADVLESLGDAQTSLGSFRPALQSYRTARRLVAGDLLRATQMLRKEALVDQRLDRLPQAMGTLTRGLRMLDADADADAAAGRAVRGRRAELAVWYAWCRVKQGRYQDAIGWATRAEADAEIAGDKAALAEAYDLLLVVNLHLGRTPPKPYGTLALALFEELDDRYRQARSLNHLGFAAAVEGRGDDAAELYRRSHEAYVQAGDAMGAAVTNYNTGDLLIYQGRLAEAETVLSRVLPVFQALGTGEWTSSTRRELGRVAVRLGRVEEGQALLLQARADLLALGLKVEVVETDAALVEVALAAKEWETALDQADAALAQARALDAATAIRLLLRHRAAALRALGRPEEARAALEQALVECEEEGQVDLGAVLTELASVAREQGDPAADAIERQGRESLTRLGYVG